MTLDILVKNVALWGSDEHCDPGIADGCFASIARAADSQMPPSRSMPRAERPSPDLSNLTFTSTWR
jgi:hypothetical protein